MKCFRTEPKCWHIEGKGRRSEGMIPDRPEKTSPAGVRFSNSYQKDQLSDRTSGDEAAVIGAITVHSKNREYKVARFISGIGIDAVVLKSVPLVASIVRRSSGIETNRGYSNRFDGSRPRNFEKRLIVNRVLIESRRECFL